VATIIDWVLHLDKHLNELITSIGPNWLYLVVFGIVFCETGLVILPFLPGDSLLFALGALCASSTNESLSLWVLIPMLTFAAIAGDALNYWLGAKIGPRIFQSESSWWLNKKHLDRAQAFYEKYGAKTIVIARFVPIVRTFAPFVAGVGKMNFTKFWMYNVVGGTVWVVSFLVAGYWFGNLEIVKKNFSLVTVGIILLSVLPIVFEWIAHRRAQSQSTHKSPSE
jgi:membrane-associated protein